MINKEFFKVTANLKFSKWRDFSNSIFNIHTGYNVQRNHFWNSLFEREIPCGLPILLYFAQ